jgi:WD40 repeat protein
VSSGGIEAIKLWDVATNDELLTLEAELTTFGKTAFSPAEDYLGTVGSSKKLHLWRAPSWEEIAAVEKSMATKQPQP